MRLKSRMLTTDNSRTEFLRPTAGILRFALIVLMLFTFTCCDSSPEAQRDAEPQSTLKADSFRKAALQRDAITQMIIADEYNAG